jgi:hypothetical protein
MLPSPIAHARSLTNAELRDALQACPPASIGSPLHLALDAEWRARVHAIVNAGPARGLLAQDARDAATVTGA